MALKGIIVPRGKHGEVPGLPKVGQKPISEADRQIIRDAYRFCKRMLLEGSSAIAILSNYYRAVAHKRKVLSTTVLALQMKEDFLVVKNFFLMGKIPSISQEPIWRKTNRDRGFPKYLHKVVTVKLTLWEKMVILTCLRVYKLLRRPAGHKVETVFQPYGSLLGWIRTIILWYDFMLSLVDFKFVKLPRLPGKREDHNLLLSPSLQKGGIMTKVGPAGNTLRARLLDL
jgi:hypothetical protein